MRVPSYRLHPSTGQARVTINGRDHLLGPYGSAESKEKYGRLIAEYSASGKSQNFGKKSEFLVEDLLLAYLQHAQQYYAGSSEFKNMKLVVRPVLDLYGTLPSLTFGPAEYRAVREKWLEDPSRSRQYVNKQMKRLLSILKWGTSFGYITGENFIGCQCVGPLKRGRVTGLREAQAVKPVADEVVEQTLLHTTQVVGDMIRFQRLTGCRPGEVCQVKPIMIDRSDKVWLVQLDKHKTMHRARSESSSLAPKHKRFCFPICLEARTRPALVQSSQRNNVWRPNMLRA